MSPHFLLLGEGGGLMFVSILCFPKGGRPSTPCWRDIPDSSDTDLKEP